MEGQVEAFARESLEFQLDGSLLHEAEVVVFRGQLRLEGSDRRSPAMVVYPPSFHLGEQPVVFAPEPDVERHRAPDGALCLDHAVFGAPEPMSGAEAVLRAERLWWLWDTDRDQLADEEADAPDPWANYIQHTPGSAVAFIDLVVPSVAESGFVDLGATSLYPLRGSVRAVRVLKPTVDHIDAGPSGEVLAGDLELSGPWKRLSERPPVATDHQARDWIASEHRAMFNRAEKAARGLRGSHPQMPALLGFVYPDEGPGRYETHDAWLLVLVRPEGQVELPRPLTIRDDERWVRQPEMAQLREKRVAIVGVGALGSQIASLLARAGIEKFHLIDNDFYFPGNRVRHDLDLSALGYHKVYSQRERMLRLNPSAEVDIHTARLGTIALGVNVTQLQRADDELAAHLGAADLIINATANPNAGSYISAIAADARTPVVHVWVSAGAWGGRILIQDPENSACSDCLGAWQDPDADPPSEPIPAISEEPQPEAILERGCADATFTGPGLELTSAAAAAARIAVQELLQGNGYPPLAFDLATLTFRESDRALPAATYTRLPPHPDCTTCRTS